MLPLIPVALSLIPDLLKILAGDKAGAVADSVAKAVGQATGTEDPKEAKAKLDADPAISDACASSWRKSRWKRPRPRMPRKTTNARIN